MSTGDDVEYASGLALGIARTLDMVRDRMPEPVWVPLEALLPRDWCGGFMFMGVSRDAWVMPDGLVTCPTGVPPSERTDWQGRPWERRTMFCYKHGITRKALHIGEDLRTYCYRADLCPLDQPVYQPIGVTNALRVAFQDITLLGADPTTPYDDAFIAARNARLVAAGYTVVG